MNKTAITTLVASVIVAAGAYFSLGTPVADAIKIAFDKDAAKVYCGKLIDGETTAVNE